LREHLLWGSIEKLYRTPLVLPAQQRPPGLTYARLHAPPRGFIVSLHGLVKYSLTRWLAMTTRRLHRRPAITEWAAGGRSGLGPLEAKVLGLLWGDDRPLTVRHVHAAFPDLAYTTMMTTLDRLYRKGLLIRCRRGRAFAYEARCSQDELLGEMMSGHVNDLLAASVVSTAILSTLVDVVGRRDAALLDELDALVQAKREQLKLGDP
jgi:predicted transcriptional regulator